MIVQTRIYVLTAKIDSILILNPNAQIAAKQLLTVLNAMNSLPSVFFASLVTSLTQTPAHTVMRYIPPALFVTIYIDVHSAKKASFWLKTVVRLVPS